MTRETLNFIDSFARRMLILAVIAGLAVGLSLPVTYYNLSSREREQNNTLRARLMADKIAEAIRDNEDFWMYDVPRFIEVSHRLPREDQVVAIKIFDSARRLVYQDIREAKTSAVIVSEAPIYFNSQLRGYLVLEESKADLMEKSALVFLGFGVLSMILALVLYRYPVKMVREAQALVLSVLDELSAAHQRLSDAAIHDGKTRLYNATHFMELLKKQVHIASEMGEPVSVAMLDLDHFKKYNDCFGHLSGDAVLVGISELLQKNVRNSDILGRFGGEEFIVLFPATDRCIAESIISRLHSVIRAHVFEGQDMLPGKNLTVSIGLATHRRGMTASELVHAADMAMYTAKESGRNQVCTCDGGQYYIDGKRIMPFSEFALQNPSFQELMRMLEQSGQENIITEDASLLTSYLKILDSRESDTAQHSLLVNRIAMALGRKLELAPNELLQLNWGTLLHDIGKLGISDAILLKPTKLTGEEYEIIQRHPLAGYEMLKSNAYLTSASLVVRFHHEKWDGNGYPDRLQGRQIPLLARICCVADTVAAMAADRPYRKASSLASIIAELQAHAGSQFDPEVVDAFLALPEKRGVIFLNTAVQGEAQTVPAFT